MEIRNNPEISKFLPSLNATVVKDSKAKEYLSDNTRFSEICNYVLFDGEKVIKPENLKDLPDLQLMKAVISEIKISICC